MSESGNKIDEGKEKAKWREKENFLMEENYNKKAQTPVTGQGNVLKHFVFCCSLFLFWFKFWEWVYTSVFSTHCSLRFWSFSLPKSTCWIDLTATSRLKSVWGELESLWNCATLIPAIHTLELQTVEPQYNKGLSDCHLCVRYKEVSLHRGSFPYILPLLG